MPGGLPLELIPIGHSGFGRLQGPDASSRPLDDILRHIVCGGASRLRPFRLASGRRSAYWDRLLPEGRSAIIMVSTRIPAGRADHEGPVGLVDWEDKG